MVEGGGGVQTIAVQVRDRRTTVAGRNPFVDGPLSTYLLNRIDLVDKTQSPSRNTPKTEWSWYIPHRSQCV